MPTLAVTPAKKRKVIIHQKVGAIPHKNVLIEKNIIPPIITRFLSRPSEMGPAINANRAYPNAYALTIQPDISVETLYNSCNAGKRGEIKNVSVPIINMIIKNKNIVFFTIITLSTYS